ncbi:MAG TPA: HAMP domain-containing sensor histidine kinase [Gaiellaceae bacterium]|nr:HAMP domain-containing sensor histidine kinase [Gaiellaceae bacterium]
MLRTRELSDFRAGATYLALGAVATGVYFALPMGNVQNGVYDAIGVSAVAATFLGIRLHRPSAPLPWALFGVGTASFAMGDILSDVFPKPSQALLNEGFYLAGYPFLAAGLLLLIYLAGGHRRLAALDEAGIATFAFAIFQWVFLTRPALNGAGSLSTRAINVAYTGADLVLLAGFTGLFVSAAWRKPSFVMLVGGVAAVLVGDEIYALWSGYYTGSALDVTWLVSYVLFGTAALHPSMRELSEPRRSSSLRVSNVRIALLMAALLTPVSILVFQWSRNKPLEVPAITAATVAISILVLWRLLGILRALEGLRMREREIRGEAEAARMLLAEQNARLREADQLKDEFVSLVSHDLRTPLTSVIGYTELAIEETTETDAQQRHYLEIVSRNAQRLLRLVDDLLFIARLQAGRGLELAPQPLDLAAIAQQAVLETQPRARDKGLDLRYTGAESVPAVADRGRIFQLLDNLVGNAIKFTPAGGLVEVIATGGSDTVSLEVRDTGIGLDPADATRLFERFYRTERATAAQIPGTGLGLFIAEAITAAHGGRISAVPRDGGGTTFRVELPAVPPAEPRPADAAELVA